MAKTNNSKLMVMPRDSGTNGESGALDAPTLTLNGLAKFHFEGGSRPKHGAVTSDQYDKGKGELVPKTAGQDDSSEYHHTCPHLDIAQAQKHADATPK